LNSVMPSEFLARYIYSRNHYRSSDSTVKYAAFIPPQDKRLSVFRISGLAEKEIWDMGNKLRAHSILGRADIRAADVSETGLQLDPDDIPQRHVNITGWPEESSAIKLKAMVLAEKARFKLK